MSSFFVHLTAGQIMLDRPLAPSSHHYCKILCVKPVAAPYSATINFRVEGSNLLSTSSRCLILINLFAKYIQINLNASFRLLIYI
jgi:hypothetical protein